MRRGISILEVLFAILVTTIGLLGAIAIFPVASSQARKGRLADEGAVAGLSAMHDFRARGMSQPNQWLEFTYYGPSGVNYPYPLPVEDPTPDAGLFDSAGNPVYPPPHWRSNSTFTTSIPARTVQIHQAWCIDPIFMAEHWDDAPVAGVTPYWFPYFPASAPTQAVPASVARMKRITLRNSMGQPPGTNVAANTIPEAMPAVMAQEIFAWHDDLTIERDNTDRSMPARQLFHGYDHDSDPSTPDFPFKRQSEDNLTWFATLVPKIGDAHTNDYMLSIVVVHQREARTPIEQYDSADPEGVNPERLVDVLMPNQGTQGGEIQLVTRPGRGSGDLHARTGEWLMLSTFRTGGTTLLDNGPDMAWYRIVSTDDIEGPNPFGLYTRRVSIQGKDWAHPDLGGPVVTQATLVSGAVAVYDKTIRLEREAQIGF